MMVAGSRHFRSLAGALCLYALLIALMLTSGVARADKPEDDDNGYTIIVGGFYHGTGTAALKSKKIDMTATIQTDDGGSGTLTVSKFKVKNNQFTGQGTICGHTATFTGRLDAPPAKVPPGHAVLGRMVVTFSVDDGHEGRIVGAQS